MRQVAYVLVGLLAGFFLAGILFIVARPPAGKPIGLEAPPTQAPIEVHVVGAVLRPGVYLFSDGSRVQDAITAAGGISSEADLEGLNLAARLEDGEQLNVPARSSSLPQGEPTIAFRVVPGVEPTATAAGDLININTASAEELATLPGIGPTTAERIIEYRTENGPFARIEDILNIAGIGPATFDNIQALIAV
jgi:competence protein ComEA